MNNLKEYLEIIKENVREWLQKYLNKTQLQIVGLIWLIGGYVCLCFNQSAAFWTLMILVGIIEAILIFAFDTTITKFVRDLFGKRIDNIILFGLIPLTWWLMGEAMAGVWTLGVLANHFLERQD